MDKGKHVSGHCDDMWRFLTGMKGKKLKYKGKDVFHTIDKSKDKQLISRQVYSVVKAVKEAAMGPLQLREEG